MANVSMNNANEIFLINSRKGEVTHAGVNLIQAGAKIMVPAKSMNAEGIDSRDELCMAYAGMLLQNYADARESNPARYGKNVLLVVPDSIAIKGFTARKYGEEAIGVLNKEWQSESYQDAQADFLDGLTKATEAGLNIGFMKLSNIYHWHGTVEAELGTMPAVGDCIEFKHGENAELGLKLDTIVSGKYTVTAVNEEKLTFDVDRFSHVTGDFSGHKPGEAIEIDGKTLIVESSRRARATVNPRLETILAMYGAVDDKLPVETAVTEIAEVTEAEACF